MTVDGDHDIAGFYSSPVGWPAGHQLGDDGAFAASQTEGAGHLVIEVLYRRAQVAARDRVARP